MAVTYIGDISFLDNSTPDVTKNEYGIDVLTRKVQGGLPKLVAYLQSLGQGQGYNFAGGNYYLQTWNNDNHRSFPTVTLIYKGFANGQPPATQISYSSSEKSMTVSAKDNNGDSQTYQIRFISSQTVARYVTNSQGFANPPSVKVDQAVVINSFYIDSTTGLRVVSSPPNSSISFISQITDGNQNPVWGTPYWETEIVAASNIET